MFDIPQISLVACVGVGGSIGPSDGLPLIESKEEAEDFEAWFLELTRGGIIVLGHNSAEMLMSRGFTGLSPDWTIIRWSKNGLYEPEKFLEVLQKSGKPIFICGGKKTYQTFMPYVTQFFIRRVSLLPPYENFMPPLFRRLQ